MNPIRILLFIFVIFGFLSCSTTPNNDVPDMDGDSTVDGDAVDDVRVDDGSAKCFGPGSLEECGTRDLNCRIADATALVLDKANNCSEGRGEPYCILWEGNFAQPSSNVFYRETNSGYEYLRISPYVPTLEESTWIPCEDDLSSSPAPGCNACEDDRP